MTYDPSKGGVSGATKFAILIVVLGLIGIGGFFGLKPLLEKRKVDALTKAKITHTIRFIGDDYLGYAFITAPDTTTQLANAGIGIDFKQDGGAYADRIQAFKDGKCDIIVLPINSWLEHAAQFDFPGFIVAGVAESKGADGLVGFKDKFPNGNINKDLGAAGLRWVFVPASPSEFLIDLTRTEFDLSALTPGGSWRVEAQDQKEVLKRIRNRDGDVFVLWEPNLSQALAENQTLAQLWGSDKFEGYVIDVFVVRPEYLANNADKVNTFFTTYFNVMDTYSANREHMLTDLSQSTGLKRDVLDVALGKIDFLDLGENAQKFGISNGGQTGSPPLVRNIVSCMNVMNRAGKPLAHPLADPYRIVSTNPLERLVKGAPAALGRNLARRNWKQLDDAGWNRLKEVGSLRLESVTFVTGSDALDDAGAAQIDSIAQMLKDNYPGYRVAVRGHTGEGDEAEMKALSQARADAVVRRLINTHGIDANRIRGEGRGFSQKPPRKPGEGQREYLRRLPRVEFVLLEGNEL